MSKFDKGLTIQELEDRHELTAAIATEMTKDDDNDTEIDRCSGNSGG